jgi:hypothetical protein
MAAVFAIHTATSCTSCQRHSELTRPPWVRRSTFDAIGIGIMLLGFGVRSV